MLENYVEVAIRAMSDIEDGTCIRFKERDNEAHYIRMSRACNKDTGKCIDSTAISSMCNQTECFQGGWVQGGVGRKSSSGLFIGKSSVHISSQINTGFITHEVLHSLGVEHTQRRPDRNESIDVDDDNLQSAPTALHMTLHITASL